MKLIDSSYPVAFFLLKRPGYCSDAALTGQIPDFGDPDAGLNLINAFPSHLQRFVGNVVIILHLPVNHPFRAYLDNPVTDSLYELVVMR